MKFYIQLSKIDQFRNDLTAFGTLKFKTNNTFFLFSLISTNFEKLSLADIFEDQQMSWIFSHPHFMLVIRFVSDGIKKCIRNCKIC